MTKGKFILPIGGTGDGKTVEFRIHEGWIQWRYADQSPEDEWVDLIQIPSEGKAPEMRYHDGWFQWRYADQDPEDEWKDLVEINFADGDFTINEYGYWELSVDLTEEEIDKWYEDNELERPTDGTLHDDVKPTAIEVESTNRISVQGLGTVRLVMNAVTKRLTVIGARVEFRVEDNWLEYRYTYDDQEIGEDEGWTPIVNILFGEDTDISFGEGLTPEFREHEGWVQWRYVGQEPEDEWKNLFEIPTVDHPDVSEGGTTIEEFEATVGSGSVPSVGSGQSIRLRIKESNNQTHDVYIGGQAGLNFWHGDESALPEVRDANTIYYVNE